MCISSHFMKSNLHLKGRLEDGSQDFKLLGITIVQFTATYVVVNKAYTGVYV